MKDSMIPMGDHVVLLTLLPCHLDIGASYRPLVHEGSRTLAQARMGWGGLGWIMDGRMPALPANNPGSCKTQAGAQVRCTSPKHAHPDHTPSRPSAMHQRQLGGFTASGEQPQQQQQQQQGSRRSSMSGILLLQLLPTRSPPPLPLLKHPVPT